MNNSRHALVCSAVRRAVIECVGLANGLDTSLPESPSELFSSPFAKAIKQEILHAGRKLWERQYVDGNGGNISARLSQDFVICTPTLCSKGDLREEDLCLVDLDNEWVCGGGPQTSEIRLHLEIYKAVAKAKAVIHCHPPYATAHAIAGVVPPGNLIPEQEVFVGPLALSSYETPGTQSFAETVLPFVQHHNTTLLRNHGIVCWADTVTHAEWYVEVVENYCKTVMIASQLRTPLEEIPPEKIRDLLAIKRKLGLPDRRLTDDVPSVPAEIVESAISRDAKSARQKSRPSREEIDALVTSLTAQVLSFLEKRHDQNS